MTISRTHLRNEFPRGWWRSPRWWFAGALEAASKAVVTMAPMLLIHKTAYAVRHRRSPIELARIDGEGFVYGFVSHLALISLLVLVTFAQPGMLPMLLGLGAYLLVNAAVAGTVVVVLAISRWHERADWSAIDFIDKHGAVGRPPETPAEYEADRLKCFLAGK